MQADNQCSILKINTPGTGEIYACGDMSQSLDGSAQEAANLKNSQ
jgi:hypothetical protein